MKIHTLPLPVILFLLSFTARAQTWKWAHSVGIPDHTTAIKNIRPYSGTSVLVSGSFASPTLSLGSHTLANAGQDDGYVAIVNDSGQYLWADKIGGSGRDFIVDAAAGPDGAFAVAGNFNSLSLLVGGTNLPSSGETDGFVVKYNPDHSLAWAHKIGTADIDEVTGIGQDAAGNIYVAGQVHDKITYSALNLFLRKYDAAGNLAWEKKGNIEGSGILQTTELTMDGNDDIYLGGTLSGVVVFDGMSLSNNWDYSGFIVKFNTTGAVIDTFLTPDVYRFNGLKAHENHIYACAERMQYGIGWGWPLSDSKIHVLKLDTDLNIVWEKSTGGEEPSQSLDIARNISVDDQGNAYVTGYFFSDTLTFAGQVLPNFFNIHYYYPQIFVLKYDASGAEVWAKSFGGIHSDEGTGIHAFGDDQFYLGGNYESEPVAFGDYELHNTGTLDSMYVHLRPSRFLRKTMGFLGIFDKNVNSTHPEPAFQEVVLFPNPATDHLVLRLKSPAGSPVSLQISSIDGRVLHQSEHSGQFADIREDLGRWTPGLYFVTLRTAKGQFSGKFIKQ